MEVISGPSPPKNRLRRRARPDLRLVRPGDLPRVRQPAEDFLLFLMAAVFCLMFLLFAGFLGTWTGGNGGAQLRTGSGWSAGSWR